MELKKAEKSMFAHGGADTVPGVGAVSAATYLLYRTRMIIKGHHCLSYLSMKDSTKLFCIKNEIDLGCRGSLP